MYHEAHVDLTVLKLFLTLNIFKINFKCASCAVLCLPTSYLNMLATSFCFSVLSWTEKSSGKVGLLVINSRYCKFTVGLLAAGSFHGWICFRAYILTTCFLLTVEYPQLSMLVYIKSLSRRSSLCVLVWLLWPSLVW